ncbi:hypothetical protein GUJ93_ZPchr0012g21675 [Zizania palustris]|uniref:Uncharacterized protein n=1 Tax=Zizania palustris TaxID=103762 RepID=A0A8J6BQ07_ZIZPA|nr:hypothetical protein GUJ93_ZPchr0012g21675 [Zizania palustris]
MDLPASSVSHGEAEAGPTRRRLGARGLVDREELLRVIAQSLYSLGYRKAAAALEAESGVPLYPPEHDHLLFDVMSGRWDACVATIRSMAGIGDRDRVTAEFLVWRGHFLELLGIGDAGLPMAREVLWRRIAPLGIDRGSVHWLARSMISCEGAVAPDAVIWWRIGLFLDLIDALPPWFHVPSSRLEFLVENAVIQQVSSCLYHNLPDEVTLFEDHKCHEEQIPSKCSQILCDHKNEVWFVRFSNDGNYLASSSSDSTAIIWKVEDDDTITKKHCLEGHKKPISFVAWSPNDRMLLTCEKIVCASSEPESAPNRIFTCDLEGQELEAWVGDRIPKVSDIAVTPDGKHLICEIHMWRINESSTVLDKFRGHKQGKFVIRSCFGGSNSLFIASGSEDSQVYIWKRHLETPIKVLNGHSLTVNCVSWNPARPHMLASASDDRTVRIWLAHKDGIAHG